jgi:hypothetical protein
MRKLMDKIEAVLTAEAFAEAGEHESALTFLQSSEARKGATARSNHRYMRRRSRGKVPVGETLAQHFTAAAFAESGDLDTARRMLHGSKKKQTVLLAIEGEAPNEASFDYTINLCRRLDANLDILQMIPDGGSDGNVPSEALSALLPRLESEGIPFKVTVRMAKAGEILADHLRSLRHVVTAVIDSPSLRDKQATGTNWRGILRNITQKLSVPLVTALQREPMEVSPGAHSGC